MTGCARTWPASFPRRPSRQSCRSRRWLPRSPAERGLLGGSDRAREPSTPSVRKRSLSGSSISPPGSCSMWRRTGDRHGGRDGARALAQERPSRRACSRPSPLPTLAAMLFSVALVSASLDVDGTENLNERYVFYVVPVHPRPCLVGRGGLAATATVDVACSRHLLPPACAPPIDQLEYNAGFQSVALLPWLSLSLTASRSQVALRPSPSRVEPSG